MQRSQPLLRTTRFPNVLLDAVMPTLKDTEWRVLCVVVRQTIGFGKDNNWISRHQLKFRTHRESEAISKAVDSLVKRGLIEVIDGGGALLRTAAQRRRGTRLIYRLGSSIMTSMRKSELGCSENELRKANTTKERPDKRSPYGGGKDFVLPPAKSESSTFNDTGEDTPNPDVRRFLQLYIDLFKQHTTSGDPPFIVWGKDGSLVKQLLKVYTYDRLAELLRAFFATKDPWVRKLGYSLGAFKAAITKLLIEEEVTTVYRRDPASGQWVKEARREHE